ncbi:hypothetical protein BZA77DRAFT_298434 [Pyronema omphalodes]|nr:hypothetical protein BZA77DRAFT_298434 [Pyronema omphalodes]
MVRRWHAADAFRISLEIDRSIMDVRDPPLRWIKHHPFPVLISSMAPFLRSTDFCWVWFLGPEIPLGTLGVSMLCIGRQFRGLRKMPSLENTWVLLFSSFHQ